MGRKSENKEKYGVTKAELKEYEAAYKKHLKRYNQAKKGILFAIPFLIIGICCVLFIPHTAGIIIGWMLIGYNGFNLFLRLLSKILLIIIRKILKIKGSDVE